MPQKITAADAPDGQTRPTKWTVMVFMGVSTIAGEASLTEAAVADLEEMCSVGSGGGLNIFVQIHDGTAVPLRGRLRRDTSGGINALKPVPTNERRTEDGQALLQFIEAALKEAGHNPNNKGHCTLLVLWGHAYDFAIGRSKKTDGTIDALEFSELEGVLETLQRKFGSPDAKLNILGFDACDLATVEMACQLEPFADYLLASQIGIPIPGWPYDRILDRLRYPFGDLMSPMELGSWIVRRFCESYSAETRTASLTLLNLKRANELFVASEALALTLASAIDDPGARDRIANLFAQSQTGPGKPYVDVADLCLNLVRSSDDVFVTEAATALGDFLISPRPPLVGKSDKGEGRPFVIDHGRNTGQTARLNGLSIYAPHVAPDRNFGPVQPLYENFSFARETPWSKLVHALAASS